VCRQNRDRSPRDHHCSQTDRVWECLMKEWDTPTTLFQICDERDFSWFLLYQFHFIYCILLVGNHYVSGSFSVFYYFILRLITRISGLWYQNCPCIKNNHAVWN
jgi:hypothetical protein